MNDNLPPNYKAALNAVLSACDDLYAKSYAKAGLSLTKLEDQQTQALYILNNLKTWRGEEARWTKQWLKDFIKTGK